MTSAQVRKDLSYLGSYGTRGVGYDVDELITEISDVLGLTQDWRVVIVGVGNLGRALATYHGFTARGFNVTALIDADADKVGTTVGGVTVRGVDAIPHVVGGGGPTIAILATPADEAQRVADDLVAAGVTAILNFAPARIDVPAHVHLRKVDLSTELQILAFYEQQTNAPRREARGA